MRIEPRLDAIVNGERGIHRGIQACVERQCLVSAVTLIFSGIDALAALIRPPESQNTSKDVFTQWVDRYIHPRTTLSCSSTDLYAARCGVLHTYSPESRLERSGKARQLVYQWHEGPGADSKVPLPEGALVIEMEALYNCFERATDQFLHDSEVDPNTKNLIQHHLDSLLCYSPWPTLQVSVAA